MATLLEQLEGLLDELGNDDMEVDYHVSATYHEGSGRSLTDAIPRVVS